MNRPLLTCVALVGSAVALGGAWVAAQPGVPAPMPATPPAGADAARVAGLRPAEPADPGFAPYADLPALAEAWRSLDCPALADAGFRLAEGERVLLRTHRAGVTATDVLRLASRAAAEVRCRPTVDRLARYAEGRKDAALTAAVNDAIKALDTPSPYEAVTRVNVDELDPDQFTFLKGAVNVLRHARLAGDAALLDDLGRIAADAPLPRARRDAVAAAVADTRAGLKTRGPGDPAVVSMNRLLQRTGGCNPVTGWGCFMRVCRPATGIGCRNSCDPVTGVGCQQQ